jgi:D-glycero-D-manno-heptose 1,7-bisphosphate phosphatase
MGVAGGGERGGGVDGSATMYTNQVGAPRTAAVFLDRDDTLIECNGLAPPRPPAAPGDLIDPALVTLLPGVLEGCRAMRAAGFELVIASNQGSVARGGTTCEGVEAVNGRVRSLLVDASGHGLIRAAYFCPFHPRDGRGWLACEHAWRKPGAGMILAAAAELSLAVADSWLIGDAQRDIDAGFAAGLARQRCLRVGPELSFADAVGRVLGRGVGHYAGVT